MGEAAPPLWDLNKIAVLQDGQVYDEYTPRNEELYGFDEISKEKYHPECVRELFAEYQRLVLRNRFLYHHVWVNHFFKGEIERQAPQPNRAKKKGMSETAYFHFTSPAAEYAGEE